MHLVIKLASTAYLCILAPIYWHYYGPRNFLWFSDIALVCSVVALWCESSLLASTQPLSVMVLELFWSVDFLARLSLDPGPLRLSQYMFRSTKPLFVRLLSLFHLWLPWLLVWMVCNFGYNARALVVQTLVCWIVLAISYCLSTPRENINWVYGLGWRPQHRLP